MMDTKDQTNKRYDFMKDRVVSFATALDRLSDLYLYVMGNRARSNRVEESHHLAF